MFRVADIHDEARRIIGVCDDTKLFRWLADAVSLISNKEDLEGWKGYLDICTAGCSTCTETTVCNNASTCGRRLVALPREVETVIGVNIGGQPVLGYNQLFSFHLNGPGDCRTVCEWKYTDQGKMHCTYRDLLEPAKIVAYLQTVADNGKVVLIYGYDSNGNVLRRQVGGVWQNGYQIPTIYGLAVPEAGAPTIARITGIYKDPSVGSIRLSTIDDSGSTGILLTVMEPDETLPEYRRIQLNRSCNWIRIAYRKTNPTFNSVSDHVPLKSRVGFLLAVQARKHYADNQIAEAHSFEADATRMELEAQQMAEPPSYMPPQILDMNSVKDKADYYIT